MRCKMSITATPRRQKITAGTKIGVILAVFGSPENKKMVLTPVDGDLYHDDVYYKFDQHCNSLIEITSNFFELW